MHPEISSFIRPIYPRLIDAPSTIVHPSINGLKHRIFFLNHTIPEDGATGAFGAEQSSTGAHVDVALSDNAVSTSNAHEARMIICVLRYLLFNGYAPQQLVVLSLYKGQNALMKRLAREAGPIPQFQIESLDSIRMTTVDNYQVYRFVSIL